MRCIPARLPTLGLRHDGPPAACVSPQTKTQATSPDGGAYGTVGKLTALQNGKGVRFWFASFTQPRAWAVGLRPTAEGSSTVFLLSSLACFYAFYDTSEIASG
jgi:hypothetical protein